MTTPHNDASLGDIAKIVLMPGDPLRAEFIAKTYFENCHQFNTVRNMYGYTGYYKGHKLSVMGSGMGMPSIGIYSYELFKFYDVAVIIRIGSAGAYTKDLNLYDLLLVESAWSESTFAKAQAGIISDTQHPSFDLNKCIEKAAVKLATPITKGRVHSSDVFYHENNVPDCQSFLNDHQCLCVEMESYALFHNAMILKKKAACLLTISDSLVTYATTSAQERQTSFHNMIAIALETAISLY